jgi:hypothetical protein
MRQRERDRDRETERETETERQGGVPFCCKRTARLFIVFKVSSWSIPR